MRIERSTPRKPNIEELQKLAFAAPHGKKRIREAILKDARTELLRAEVANKGKKLQQATI